MGGSNGFALLSLTSPPVRRYEGSDKGRWNEALTGGRGNEVRSDRHPTSFRLGDPRNSPCIRPDELEVG